MSGITINEDSTHFFYTRSAEEMIEECVDRFIDIYADTQVREMMFNVNARYPWHRSAQRRQIVAAIWRTPPSCWTESPLLLK